MLAADGESDLGHEAIDFDLNDAADELVAARNFAEVFAAGGDRLFVAGTVEEAVEFGFGDAVVAAGGFDGFDFLFVDPLLESGVTDAEDFRGLARGNELRSFHGSTITRFGRGNQLAKA